MDLLPVSPGDERRIDRFIAAGGRGGLSTRPFSQERPRRRRNRRRQDRTTGRIDERTSSTSFSAMSGDPHSRCAAACVGAPVRRCRPPLRQGFLSTHQTGPVSDSAGCVAATPASPDVIACRPADPGRAWSAGCPPQRDRRRSRERFSRHDRSEAIMPSKVKGAGCYPLPAARELSPVFQSC